MTRSMRVGVHALVVFCAIVSSAVRAAADEIWVAPTMQQDVGGLGIGSSVIWPATPIGVSRFAWGVPDNLQTFQGAKVVLIPHAPGDAATLNVFVCAAENGQPVTGTCAGPFAHPFTGGANRLAEVDISADLAPAVGAAGLNNLAVIAFTSPTTTTDHVVGMRFVFDPKVPTGVATLGANAFTGTQTAPAFVGDGSGVSNVNANLLDGLDSTAFAPTAHGHNVSQITNAARLAGGNTFTGSQTLDNGSLDLDASTAASGNILKSGSRFLHNAGTNSIYLGVKAGTLTNSGADNIGVGTGALGVVDNGLRNSGIGNQALAALTVGQDNTSVGAGALASIVDITGNTAVGSGALASLQNTALAGPNTAVGLSALGNLTNGGGNTVLGGQAGKTLTAGNGNIYIDNAGGAAESLTIRIGDSQTRAFIKGIHGVTTGSPTAIPVLVDSNGQLGTVSSSRRFKEDIRDMADASRRLYQLRPVTFRYTRAYTDGSKPVHFGLIAEEVAEVFPELAARGADGEIETVHYETLNVLLLNEVQKQQKEIERAKDRIGKLEQQLEALLRGVLKTDD